MTNVQAMSPVDIDTELARLYGEEVTAENTLERAMTSVRYAAGDRKAHYGSGPWGMTYAAAVAKVQEVADTTSTAIGRAARETLAKVSQAHDALTAVRAEAEPYNAEFERRGGWTRAFLVTNSNGHVHSSMHCSTCNRGLSNTGFAWMTEWSAASEEAIVEAAGWRACTVCYPSAPVNAYRTEKEAQAALPTKMFSEEDKAKAAAAEERRLAKEARLAKTKANAPTASGEPLRVLYSTSPNHNKPGEVYKYYETFKTERSAIIWATDQYWYSDPEGLTAEAVKLVAEAVAEKRGVEVATVLTEIETKGKKKAGRT